MPTAVSPAPAAASAIEFNDADLTIIRYPKLLAQDAAEHQRLLSACKNWGFFYLDMNYPESEGYLENVAKLFDVGKKYFAKPVEEKLKDTRDELEVFNVCGFKPLGARGLDSGNAKAKKNGSEALRIPVDLFYNPDADPRLRLPKGISDHRVLVKDYIISSRDKAILILSALSSALGLIGADRFENFHRADAPTTSSAALQYYPLTNLPPDASVGHFTHTDTGSLTILFNSDWGLQVHSPFTEEWLYVAPRPGCAIVNVGDTLRFLSRGVLTSSLHRVVPFHGRWTQGDRYATIFFLRASNNSELIDAEGNRWTAKQWLEAKFGKYRLPHQEQEKSSISTGKAGFVGLYDEARPAAVVA